MKRPRVLLADDHRVLSEGLKSLLQPHFDVVGIVSDGRELVERREKARSRCRRPRYLDAVSQRDRRRPPTPECELSGESGFPDHAPRSHVRRAGAGGRCLRLRPEALGGLRTGYGHPGSPQGGDVHHPSDRLGTLGLIPARVAAGGEGRANSLRANGKSSNSSPKAARPRKSQPSYTSRLAPPSFTRPASWKPWACKTRPN